MKQENKNSINPVGWFEIYVDDLERAQKFYETVLDIKMQHLPDTNKTRIKMTGFPMKKDAPNTSGAIVQMEGVEAGGMSTIVYFNSADCAKEEARVKKAGGEVIKKKMPVGKDGFVSLCKDTEGNMFGIRSMK
jgi:uncharacterized protein